MAAKAMRQPANPAINVPAGTPRTVAIEIPAAMIVVARVIIGRAKSLWHVRDRYAQIVSLTPLSDLA
jgi:hypothetical protein